MTPEPTPQSYDAGLERLAEQMMLTFGPDLTRQALLTNDSQQPCPSKTAAKWVRRRLPYQPEELRAELDEMVQIIDSEKVAFQWLYRCQGSPREALRLLRDPEDQSLDAQEAQKQFFEERLGEGKGTGQYYLRASLYIAGWRDRTRRPRQ